MAQPTDLQTQMNTVQWTNGRQAITGSFIMGLFALIMSIFSGMGQWTNGTYSANVNAASVVAGLGYTPANRAGDSMRVLLAPASFLSEDLAALIKDVNALRAYGYIGDGNSHPLSSVTSFAGQSTANWSLAQWQGLLPAATSLSDEADWVAIASLLNAQSGPKSLLIPANSRAVSNHAITCDPLNTCRIGGEGGAGTSGIMFTNPAVGQAGIIDLPASEDKWLEVSDLALMTNVNQPSNAAIAYYLSGAVLNISRGLQIHGNYIGPNSYIYPYNYYWTVGVDERNASFGGIDNNTIIGLGNSNGAGGNASGPIGAANMGCAIRLTGTGIPPNASPLVTDEMHVDRNLVWQSATGVCLNGDAEFTHVNDNSLEGVNVGISQVNAGGASAGKFQGNYTAAYTNCLIVSGAAIGRSFNNICALVPAAGVTAVGESFSTVQNFKSDHDTVINYSGAAGITTIGYDPGTPPGQLNSFDHDECVGLTACANSHGATSGGPVFWDNIQMSGVSSFDYTAGGSPTFVFSNMFNLPTVDQLPTLTPGSATPNVSFPSPFIQTGNTSPKTITSLTGVAFGGREVTIYCKDTNTSFANGTSLYTLGGGTVTCAVGKPLKFQPIGQGIGLAIQTQ